LLFSLLTTGYNTYKRSVFVFNKLYYLTYKPDWVRWIDSQHFAMGLTNGIADFWFANVYTAFATTPTTCYSVFSDLCLYPMINNTQWYSDSSTRKCKNKPFNYILWNKGIDTTIIYTTFGKPLLRKEWNDFILYKVSDFDFEKYNLVIRNNNTK
jgi:hypothetical protein